MTAPSNISIYGNVTTEKFVLLRFSGDNIFNHNKQRLSYAGAFVYFPGAFYGVGYNAGAEGYAQELTTTMGIFRISYCTALAGRFYIGVSGGIDYTGAKYKDTGMVAYMNNVKADVDAGKPVPGGRGATTRPSRIPSRITLPNRATIRTPSTPASASSPNTTRAT